MRKINYLFSICCCLVMLLNSCQKDADIITQAQQEGAERLRTCGSDAHMAKLLQDPSYRSKHESKLAKVAKMAAQKSAPCGSPVIIPVAIHYQNISNGDIACLRTLAQNQIDILNSDYQGINEDISNWSTAASTFPGVSNGETCIRFVIANKNHPSGYGLAEGDLAVTLNKVTGDEDNKWSGYLNVFVQPNLGFLGYSPLGGSGQGDGVVVDASAFGAGNGCTGAVPSAPYNLGRTLTHEIGHYMLLDHIWGGGCNVDDNVDDTPSQSDSNYGCPSLGKASCGTADLHMNYMDYTDDACMYMFSAGQSSRMENYVAASLQNIVNNASNVIGGVVIPDPTCDDGIQNGNETGVDCGGSCEPCVVVDPTCDDGIQNGNETGIDCGGSCEPCIVVDPTCDDGIKNGDETGIDCGGSCEPCETDPNPPACNIMMNRYASFSNANATEVRTIAKMIIDSDNPGAKKIVRKLIANQDAVMNLMVDLNNDEMAKGILKQITQNYNKQGANNFKVAGNNEAMILDYLSIAKSKTNDDKLNGLINEAIQLLSQNNDTPLKQLLLD